MPNFLRSRRRASTRYTKRNPPRSLRSSKPSSTPLAEAPLSISYQKPTAMLLLSSDAPSSTIGLSAEEKLRSDIEFLTTMRDRYIVENIKVRVKGSGPWGHDHTLIAMNNRTIEQYNRSIAMFKERLCLLTHGGQRK